MTTSVYRCSDDDISRPADLVFGKRQQIQLRVDVTYIVAGVLLRNCELDESQIEVLMVQEAKASCRGRWYLPAGRVEPGETLITALKREVKEESGIEAVPEFMTSIEVHSSSWYRFTFYCTAVGGSLKTIADKESLSSKWCLVDDLKANKVSLRSRDCIAPIDDAIGVYRRRQKTQVTTTIGMPASVPTSSSIIDDRSVVGIFFRFVIVRRVDKTLEMIISRCDNGTERVPIIEIGPNMNVLLAIDRFYQKLSIDGRRLAVASPDRCIGIRCLTSPSDANIHDDGLCVTVWCRLLPHELEKSSMVNDDRRYHWKAMDTDEECLEHHSSQFRVL